MRFSTQVKPISYLKANAAGVLEQLSTQREPLVITERRGQGGATGRGLVQRDAGDLGATQRSSWRWAIRTLKPAGSRPVDRVVTITSQQARGSPMTGRPKRFEVLLTRAPRQDLEAL